MKTGLVLEGGGLRGMYTVGVLDLFLENHLMPDYCIGVSAGACNGASYVARQLGRNKRINMEYIDDPRYISLRNMVRQHSLFGLDFLFEEMSDNILPFDYDTFFSNPCEFVVVVSDTFTGRPAYFDKSHIKKGDMRVLKASASLPGFSPAVEYQGRNYLDGGTTDSIPFRHALEDGCDRVIVILTQDRAYKKGPSSMRPVYHTMLRNAPQMIRALDRRHEMYNRQRKDLWKLEEEGKAILVVPSRPLDVSRFERDKERLEALYELGQADAREKLDQICAWIGHADC